MKLIAEKKLRVRNLVTEELSQLRKLAGLRRLASIHAALRRSARPVLRQETVLAGK